MCLQMPGNNGGGCLETLGDTLQGRLVHLYLVVFVVYHHYFCFVYVNAAVKCFNDQLICLSSLF